MDRKVIAAVGATGAQGGSLVRAILADPAGGFTVRALTRKPDSEKALALAKLGAEVVQADLDDAASLARAFAGAYGAFCLTNFWEHFSADKEVAQARNMAQAARAAGVRHVVWSTLEDTRKWVPLSDPRLPTLQGKYKVPHFDGKGEADKLFQGLPTTYLATSFYWDNFIHFGMGPKKGADGRLGIALPMGDKKLPGIAAEDIGKAAYGVFKRGSELIGKTVGIAGEHVSGREMAAAFTRAIGQEVVYQDVAPEAYRALDFPGADDLGNMFQFKRDFNDEFRKSRDVEATRRLNPALKSFERWLAEHRSEISRSLEKA
jgi:uncharacterized protein YbjT (DUF2867 family)